MDHDGGRGDYLQMAWLLREKLNDFMDDDKREMPGLQLQKVLNMVASRRIVSFDAKVMYPVLWSKLPKELLELVLARLPLREVARLRCLSKEWKRDMGNVSSDINRACEQAYPTMVALISSDLSVFERFSVRVYDVRNRRWPLDYSFHLRDPFNGRFMWESPTWIMLDACDGGLVCFLSLWKPTARNRMSIVVMNLLKGVQHELPPMYYLYVNLPRMVQIKVDPETKSYVVLVLGDRGNSLAVETYHSSARQWTRRAPPCGSIFGQAYTWESVDRRYFREATKSPAMYDFADSKLKRLYGGSSSPAPAIDTVLQKDKLFVLHTRVHRDDDDDDDQEMERKELSITEHHVRDTNLWVRAKSYEIPLSKGLMVVRNFFPRMRLRACDGFLMVLAYNDQQRVMYWLLDLSTSEWSILPQNRTVYKHLDGTPNMVCRAFWNVIP